jgi:hypothetical protein
MIVMTLAIGALAAPDADALADIVEKAPSEKRVVLLYFTDDQVSWLREAIYKALLNLRSGNEPAVAQVLDAVSVKAFVLDDNATKTRVNELLGLFPGHCNDLCQKSIEKLYSKFDEGRKERAKEFLDGFARQTHRLEVSRAEDKNTIVLALFTRELTTRTALLTLDTAAPSNIEANLVQKAVLRLFPDLDTPPVPHLDVRQITPYGVLESPFLSSFPVVFSANGSEDAETQMEDLDFVWRLDGVRQNPEELITWERSLIAKDDGGTYEVKLEVRAGLEVRAIKEDFQVVAPHQLQNNTQALQILRPARCGLTGNDPIGCIHLQVDSPLPGGDFHWKQVDGPPVPCRVDDRCSPEGAWHRVSQDAEVTLDVRRAGTYGFEVLQVLDKRPSAALSVTVEAPYTRSSLAKSGGLSFGTVAGFTATTGGAQAIVGLETGLLPGALARIASLISVTQKAGLARPPAVGLGLTVHPLTLLASTRCLKRVPPITAIQWNPSADLHIGARANVHVFEWGRPWHLELAAGPQVSWTSWSMRAGGVYHVPMSRYFDVEGRVDRFADSGVGMFVELAFSGARYQFVRDYKRLDQRVETALRARSADQDARRKERKKEEAKEQRL